MKLTAIAGIKNCKPVEQKRSGNWTKTVRVMKLTAIILLAACLQVSANGFGQKVSISVKDATLETVIEKISKQTGYSFFYNVEWMEKAKKVTAELNNVDIERALETVFKEQPVSYKIISNTVVLTLKENKITETTAEEVSSDFLSFIPITGIITDSTGKPLEGANVEVKGTKKRTTTDKDGRFMIDAKQGDVLVVSYVGYGRQEIRLSNQTTIRISLKIEVAEEEGVIINTGYQKISKEKFVGAYSQLDSAAYNRRQGMSIIDRLDGTVTGVLFDKKAGGIQIRGISTLGLLYSPPTAPLIILDNFRFSGDINSINPNDVDNITVLKDAAATSLYGAQGGNGVIVITTKRGKYNAPFYASVRSNVTITEKPDLFYYPQMGISDFIDLEKFLFSKNHYDANLDNRINPTPTSPVVDVLQNLRNGTITQFQADAQIDAFRKQDLRNDINKYVNRAAIAQQYYANFGGGTSQTNYGFSLGYNRTINGLQGSKPNEQYTLASTYAFRPLKNFEIQAAVNFSQAVNKSVSFSLPNLAPYAQLADANGNSIAVPYLYRLSFVDTVAQGKLLDWHYNPLNEIRNADVTNKNRSINLNLSSSYRFNNWLSATLNYNYNTALSSTRNYSNLQSFVTRDLINKYTNLSQTNLDLKYPIPVGGILSIENNEANSYGARGQLNINKSFGIRHAITSIIAGEVTQAKSGGNTNRFYAYDPNLGTYKSSINYNVPFPIYFGGSANIPQSNTIGEGLYNRFVSVLGNASYTYDNKYVFYASARRDGSNVFGANTNNKWKPLWSVGASWMLSREKFYNIKWLSSLRLSSSYGYTGNVNNSLAGVPTMSYSQQPASFYNLVYGQVGDAPNPDLKWEEVKIFNIAADFSLFNDRLSGRFDFFHKDANNLIAPFPFPPSSGVDQYIVNSANMKGNGFEFNLSSINTTGRIKWTTNFGLSHAKMIITKLYAGSLIKASEFVNYGVNSTVGRVAYGIGSYRWAGLDPATGDPMGFYKGLVTKSYASIINDTIDNQVFHGSAIPLYQGYLLNSLSWKGFSLSFNITYRLGFYFRRPALNYKSLFSGLPGDYSDYALRWQKPGDEQFTNVPSLTYPSPSNGRDEFYQNSEINVLRGDNIRLQDVRLAYDKLVKLSKNNPRQTMQFFVYPNGLNLILWRKNDAQLDPDFTGASLFAAPPPRTWTVGLNINL